MLEFLSGTLDPRISFTRNTSGTYYSNGLVTTASANVPRFQSNPVTGASEGLLIEFGITNLVCGSETFATSGGVNNWTDTNITRDGTLRISPDGTANALRIAASAGNATILNDLALSSAARTFSVWIRRVTGTGNVELTMDGGSTWTAQAITTTWTRFTRTATTTAHVGIRVVASGDEIEIWGAQVEAQAFASSYIPTTVATVARGSDIAVMTGTNFSSWYNPSEGTILCFHSGRTSGAAGRAVEINNNSATERIVLSTDSTSATYLISDNGSAQVNLARSAFAASIAKRYAAAYSANNFAVSFNGAAALTDNSGTLPTVDRMWVGQTNTGVFLDSTISRIAYWPIRLPNATLQVLSA